MSERGRIKLVLLGRRIVVGGAAVAALVALLVGLGRGEIVFEATSPFGDVRVVERSGGVRELYLGEGPRRQTAMRPEAPLDLQLPYTAVMLLAAGTLPDQARILVVGLGGGAMPRWLRIAVPNAQIAVVEISPAVVRAAREWFGFETDSLMTVHVEDAADFVARTPAQLFDLIILDAFDATGVPEALQSKTFFDHVHRILTPEGVVASNLHLGSPTYETLIGRHRSLFRELGAVKVPRRRQEILFAANRPEGLSATALVAARARLEASPAGAPISASTVRRGFRSVR